MRLVWRGVHAAARKLSGGAFAGSGRGRLPAGALSAVILLMGLVLPGCASTRNSSDLEQRQTEIRTLLEIEAIKRVQYTYAFNADHGKLDALMEAFAEDAGMEIAMPEYTGRVEGKEAIRRSLAGAVRPGRSMMHAIVMPSVSVNGNNASGAFYILNIAPSSVKCGDGQAAMVWRRGWYNNEYRKIDGEWKIAELRFSAEQAGTLQGCGFDGPWDFHFP